MANALDFVGLPDWRSALLAAVFTLPWLVALGRGYLRRWPLWAAVAAGAIVFPISIAWVQVPIQNGLSLLWTRLLDMATIQRYLLAVAAPSVAVSGLVQESAKLLVAMGGLALLHARREPRAGLAVGVATGAGFGGIEAFWVFNVIFASGLTWGSVQLYGPLALLGFMERFYTVPFHAAAAALAAYGYASGRPWRFLLLASALHAVSNYGAVLVQAGSLGALGVEAWGLAFAAATVAAAFWLRRRVVRTATQA